MKKSQHKTTENYNNWNSHNSQDLKKYYKNNNDRKEPAIQRCCGCGRAFEARIIYNKGVTPKSYLPNHLWAGIPLPKGRCWECKDG